MKKKCFSLLLSFAVLCVLLPGQVFAGTNNPFGDVSDGAWYSNAVDYVYENGLMAGTGDTTFSPDQTLSKGMVVTILWRAAGNPEGIHEEIFSDVAENAYYHDAILWAAENGIAAGNGDGTFHPDADVTREQLAAIVYRYVQKQGGGFVGDGTYPLGYSDANNISDWAYESLCWCSMYDVVDDLDGDGVLNPQGTASRAEAANAMYKLSLL